MIKINFPDFRQDYKSSARPVMISGGPVTIGTMRKQQKMTSPFTRKRMMWMGLTIVGVMATITFGWLFFAPSYMTLGYLQRVILSGDSEVTDWQNVFPRHVIANDPARVWGLATTSADKSATDSWSSVAYYKGGVVMRIGSDMQTFLEDSDTSSFLVIKHGKIVFESYSQGSSKHSIHTSMSAAKPFVSALTGIAIREGVIASVDDPVVYYLPEFKGKISETMTLRHLLTMTAGNKYDDQGGLTGDNTKTYWSTDLRKLASQYFRSVETPGMHMHYNDLQPQVLAMILERATGKSLAQYMQERLWKPVGMEHAASWSIDSDKTGFAQSAVGINARSRDFARFGLLYLNNGKVNGRQIVPEAWVADSIHMDLKDNSYFHGWHDSNAYGYYWWGNQRDDGSYDYYARGKYGQFIYVSPVSDTVIVRTGPSTGQIQDWPKIFEQLAR